MIKIYKTRFVLIILAALFSNSGLLQGQYCLPTVINPCFNPPITDDNITNFYTTGAQTNISNLNTSCSSSLPNNYTYYSSIPALVVERGSTFTAFVQCSQGTAGGAFAQGFRIWIDWDQNGVFDNGTGGSAACDGVLNSGTSGFQVFSQNITVPALAPLGMTRMRVRCAYNTVPASPCGQENYGETEDYNVMVVDNPNNPALSLIPDTICAGQTAFLQVIGLSSGMVRWYPTQTSNTLLFVGMNYTTPVLNTSTTYWVSITINGCTYPRIPVTVVVNPAPTLTVTASESSVCTGETVTLSAPAGYATYSWTPGTAVNDPAAAVTTSNPTSATTYSLEAVTADGCEASGSITVGVDPAPSLNINGSVSGICPGGQATITASGSNLPYTWLAVNDFTGATGPSIDVSPTQTTIYTVTSGGTVGTCPATASFTVTVYPEPYANAGLDVSYCYQTDDQLQGSGNVGSSFSWSPSTGLSSAFISNPVISALSGGTYTLTVTTIEGCTASDDVEVVVLPLPTANPGSDASYCSGAATTLNGSGGVLYQWSPATGLNNANAQNPLASPNATTDYFLTVTDGNGCVSEPSAPITVTVFPLPAQPLVNANGPLTFCEGGSVTLSTGSANTYVWSGGQNAQSFQVTSSSTHSVHIIDANGCESPESLPVTVTVNPNPPAPVVSSGGINSFCSGTSVNLSVVPTSGITWNTGATTGTITANNQGNFWATLTDGNGCESAQSNVINLSVIPLANTPNIQASGPLTFCSGDSIRLTCTSADSYTWSNGSIASSIWVDTTGTFSVVTTDECPSANMTASITVAVRELPYPNIPLDTLIDCLPSFIGLSATPEGSGPFLYQWSFGDGTGSDQSSPVHEYLDAGDYTVSLTVIDPIGCVGTQTVPGKVRILPRAELAYAIRPQVVTLSDGRVEFEGLAANSSGALWEIADITSIDSSYAQYTFADTGIYEIRYSVVTAEGCEATATDYVRVLEDFNLFVPSAFTPNNDGLNDEFKPFVPGFEVEDYRFEVYDRWGKILFQTRSIDTGWLGDGTPDGIYFWSIRGVNKLDGEKVKEQGWVMLKK